MRTALKHVTVMLIVALAGVMTLSAQHGGADRLPKILDPLGILPSPRQVLRTLDHVARTLPPVVINGRYMDYDDGYNHRSYPIQDGCCPGPVRPFYTELETYPVHHYRGNYRYEGFAQRNHFSAPISVYGHDRQRSRGRR